MWIFRDHIMMFNNKIIALVAPIDNYQSSQYTTVMKIKMALDYITRDDILHYIFPI